MIKAVYFDCFGVLYPDTYWTVVRKLGTGRVGEEVVFHDLIGEFDLGRISRDEFWDSAAELLKVDRGAIDRELGKLGSLDEDMLAYAAELKGEGLKTGILSNTGYGAIERMFEGLSIDDYFDEAVLSAEVGVVKPDLAIYQLAADRLEVNTDEVIFIDDLAKHVEGARRAGMHGIQYRTLKDLRRMVKEVRMLHQN